MVRGLGVHPKVVGKAGRLPPGVGEKEAYGKLSYRGKCTPMWQVRVLLALKPLLGEVGEMEG